MTSCDTLYCTSVYVLHTGDAQMLMVSAANLRTKILDSGRVDSSDSSLIFMLRGGTPRPTGDFPENLSQAISVGIVLVGRLGASQSHL